MEARIEIRIGRLRKVIQQVVRKLAPAQLADVAVAVRRGARVVLRGLQCLHDPARREFAEMQMRREFRRAIAIGTVALLHVAIQQRIDALSEPRLRALLARLPVFPELHVPIGRWRGNQYVAIGRCNRRNDGR